MAEKKVLEGKSGYTRGVLAGIFIGIALFMLTYYLLLLAK